MSLLPITRAQRQRIERRAVERERQRCVRLVWDVLRSRPVEMVQAIRGDLIDAILRKTER